MKTTTKILLIPFLLEQSAFGIITVHFHQTGPDVIVSFDGTLSVDPALMNDLATSTTTGAGVGDGYLINIEGSYFDNMAGNTVVVPFAIANGDGTASRPFGFIGADLIYTAAHVSGGAVGAVSTLTASSALDFFTLPGASLASLGAEGIPQDTILWSATNTADTFVFTSSVAPIPEPSVTLLGTLAFLMVLRRRR